VRHEGPLLQLVDQLYPPGASVDVPAEVARGLERVGLHTLVTRGARAAITAGSRGIADLPAVLRAAVGARLERIAVSEALLGEVRAGETLRAAGPLFPLPYDENGDLRSPFA
jgi:hypothetical protein